MQYRWPLGPHNVGFKRLQGLSLGGCCLAGPGMVLLVMVGTAFERPLHRQAISSPHTQTRHGC